MGQIESQKRCAELKLVSIKLKHNMHNGTFMCSKLRPIGINRGIYIYLYFVLIGCCIVTSIINQAEFMLFVSVFCFDTMFIDILKNRTWNSYMRIRFNVIYYTYILHHYMHFTFLYTAVSETAEIYTTS